MINKTGLSTELFLEVYAQGFGKRLSLKRRGGGGNVLSSHKVLDLRSDKHLPKHLSLKNKKRLTQICFRYSDK